MKIKNKRKEILEEIEKRYKKLFGFNKYTGPGLRKKLQRLISYPGLYVPFVVYKLGLYPDMVAQTILPTGREIQTKLNDDGIFMLHLMGVLPGKEEYRLTKFFLKNIDDNDVFYDIGANYGFYTYLALEFCKEVHSFEPLPSVFSDLSININDVNNVFLNQIALSDQKGNASLHLPKSKYLGSSTINKSVLDDHADNFNREMRVQTNTLDNYIAKNHPPTVIKLDAEWAENMIIEGGEDFLASESPIITMEVWPESNGGKLSMKAVDKLRQLSYKSYRINNLGELERVRGNLSSLTEPHMDNFVFKK